MAKTREERILSHTKQERMHTKLGAPFVNDLREGIPEFRSTSEGLVEYVKNAGILYKKVLDRVGASSTQYLSRMPDYDSGWTEDAANNAVITLVHNLNTVVFILMDLQVSNSSDGSNATWLTELTEADSETTGYVVQVKDSDNVMVGTQAQGAADVDCAGLASAGGWEGLSTHFRLRLWK